jgi:hypothetical protein
MNMPKFISELAEKFENTPKECIVGAKAFTISFLLAILGFIIAVSFSKAIGKPIVFICNTPSHQSESSVLRRPVESAAHCGPSPDQGLD